MLRVTVRPEILRWARERVGIGLDEAADRVPQLRMWESGKSQPTFNQLERFASVTHTPIGYFFLSEPPVERLPIPDLRAVAAEFPVRPSPDLLDTVYLCQQRQDWFREYARSTGESALDFIGSAHRTEDPDRTAAAIRGALGFDSGERQTTHTWTETLRRLIEQADAAGVLVMVSDSVSGNNRRRLDPDEFGSFALIDDSAPLIFVNGADTEAAQVFALAHELAHVWLGQSALSDRQTQMPHDHEIEGWCQQMAAAMLAPATLKGGDRGSRAKLGCTSLVGRRFAHAVVVSTLEGRSSFTEALRLLGLKRMSAFHALSQSLGVGG